MKLKNYAYACDLRQMHPLVPPVIAEPCTTNHRDPRQIAAVAAALFTFWDLPLPIWAPNDVIRGSRLASIPSLWPVAYRVCFFGSSKCLQDRPRKKELQPVSGYDVNMLLKIDSRRVVYRLDLAELEECYPDEKETRGSIIHHRRFSSNFNTFLRNLSVPATSRVSRGKPGPWGSPATTFPASLLTRNVRLTIFSVGWRTGCRLNR